MFTIVLIWYHEVIRRGYYYYAIARNMNIINGIRAITIGTTRRTTISRMYVVRRMTISRIWLLSAPQLVV